MSSSSVFYSSIYKKSTYDKVNQRFPLKCLRIFVAVAVVICCCFFLIDKIYLYISSKTIENRNFNLLQELLKNNLISSVALHVKYFSKCLNCKVRVIFARFSIELRFGLNTRLPPLLHNLFVAKTILMNLQQLYN